MLRLAFFGFPCTTFSVAQSKARETNPYSGPGWALFMHCVKAIERYKPDYFMGENNKSMDNKIRDKVSELLGVEPVLIDSALVSAQRRQRYYWTNFDVGQPEDRGIMLRDVLDSGTAYNDKAHTIRANAGGGCVHEDIGKSRASRIAEPVAVRAVTRGVTDGRRDDKSRNRIKTIEVQDGKGIGTLTTVQTDNMIAQPVGTDDGKMLRRQYEKSEIKHGYNEHRIYSPRPDEKTNTLTTVQKDNMIAEPVGTSDGKSYCLPATYGEKGPTVKDTITKGRKSMVAEKVGDSGGKSCAMVAEKVGTFNGSQSGHIYNSDGAKARTLQAGGGGCGDTSSAKTGLYAQRVGQIGNSQAERVYGTDGKSVGLKANGGGGGAKTGLYAVPGRLISSEAGAAENARVMAEREREHSGKQYTVRDGQITIKGKTYPIKLADGDYIIRKLSVGECRRLQTVPEWYDMSSVSSTQAYKMLGNGWTIEVIKHILSHIPGIFDEEVEVLSLYDGMSCGMIALKELGVRVKRYMAYEIDPYAIKVSKANFPEIIQLGDASGVEWHEWR